MNEQAMLASIEANPFASKCVLARDKCLMRNDVTQLSPSLAANHCQPCSLFHAIIFESQMSTGVVQDRQAEVDGVYDYQEDRDTQSFEQFLSHRSPPSCPEKFDEMFARSRANKDSSKELPAKMGADGSVELGGNASQKQFDRKRVDKMLKKQAKEIRREADVIKNHGDYLPDYDYIMRNERFFNNYLKPSLPFDRDLNIEVIMKTWTPFKYSPYNDLKSNYIRRVGERVALVGALNDIFGHNFFTYVNNKNYRFDSLNFELLKFIGDTPEKDKVPTMFEHKFITNMLGKMVICMLSDVDRAFSKESYLLNNYFKVAVKNTLNEFSHLLKTNNIVSDSWHVFETCLLTTDMAKYVYKYSSLDDTRKKLSEAYSSDEFLMEQLAANILKTFIPTIAFSYFSAIKNVYIVGRLLSIYVNKKLFDRAIDKNLIQHIPEDVMEMVEAKGGSKLLQIMTDLYVLASVMTTEYETNYVANVNVRSAPTVNGQKLSNQTEMYYINHIIAGPQYLVLKMLENSLPTLAWTLIPREEGQ